MLASDEQATIRALPDSVNDMVRRMLEFPPDAGMPINLYEPPSSTGTSYFSNVIPPGPQREAALEQTMAILTDRASKLGALAGELHSLVVRHEPVELIHSIAVPTSIGLADSDDYEDAPHTFSWDAKIEYLAGLALTSPAGVGEVDNSVTEETLRLVGDVFDAAQAKILVDSASESTLGRPGLDQASYLLQFEYLTDRMAGYTVHLEEINDEVFEPHRVLYCDDLGFCPSDAVRLVRRHMSWASRELEASRDALHLLEASDPPDERDGAILQRFLDSLYAARIWTPELLAESTQLPTENISALLRNLSTDFGCQPDFRFPYENNRVRRYPLIRLSDSKYFVPAPWSVAHAIHEWLQAYVQDNPSSPLASRYPKHRSDAAERLVQRGLERVFGEPAVFGNQHYDCSEGHGEIDCLVVSSTPIVAEVKSRGLTEKGRRGHRQRIDSVADDIVTKSFQQTRRSSSYILEEGGRGFAERQGGESVRLLASDVADVIEIAVTLERMDPLTASAGELATDDRTARVWVTSLADFLMVRDVLDDPASFLHYAKTRGESSGYGIQILTESDALGEYLVNRLTPLIEKAAEADDEDLRIVLGYCSAEINRYFMSLELGIEVDEPSTGVPAVLREALRSCASDYPETWVVIALAVMAAPPDTWRAWRHFVRKHRGERAFVLPNGDASIVVAPVLAEPELRDGAIPTLAIPRPRVPGARG